MAICNLSIVIDSPRIADAWMEWLFRRTFIYPFPPAGIQDDMITAVDRDGCQYIGSTYYAQGEGGIRVGEAIHRYIRGGGDAKFDLTNPQALPQARGPVLLAVRHRGGRHGFPAHRRRERAG